MVRIKLFLLMFTAGQLHSMQLLKNRVIKQKTVSKHLHWVRAFSSPVKNESLQYQENEALVARAYEEAKKDLTKTYYNAQLMQQIIITNQMKQVVETYNAAREDYYKQPASAKNSCWLERAINDVHCTADKVLRKAQNDGL